MFGNKIRMVIEVILRLVLLSRLCFISVLADFPTQGFFQTNKVLSLALDGTNEFSSDVFPALGLDEGQIPASPVRFEPPYLDFKEHPVGQPHLEQVTLINGQEKKPVQLLSISATTPHFHCSFFQRKAVPAGENTTFDVVFLARKMGATENTLFIRTSTGIYRYQLFAVGVPSPYRVQPWLGARIPINSSFSPYLHVHNPHSSVLQITEMFTSGPDLHLELPSNGPPANQLWAIPPYETRTVMRLRLVGREPANHTAFVQVKTNRSGRFGLVLPVEVQVSSRPGLYATVDRLDFGLLRTLDSERTITLQVTSLFAQPCLVSNVSLDFPNDAVRLTFRPVRLLPGAWRRTPLADVTFTAHRAAAPRQWSGHVIITGSQDGSDGATGELLRVPYRATVLQGALVYDANSTRFLLAASSSLGGDSNGAGVTRPISISNNFAQPVVIFNASLLTGLPDSLAGKSNGGTADVSLVKFRPPVLIPAGATLSPFSLSVSINAKPRVLQLAIYSNASHFLITVFLYSGSLSTVPRWPEQRSDAVDFGSIGPGDRRQVELAVRNENPVEIQLFSMKCDPPVVQAELMRLRGSNGSVTGTAPELPVTLRPFHQAELTLTAVGPAQLGPQQGELLIRANPTDLRLQWRLRGAEGSLSAVPDPLLLPDCFPGRAACRWLSVRSSFHQLVSVRGLTFLPSDVRFKFAPLGLPQLLKSFETTTVGKICFDHQRLCGHDCYVGFPLTTATGKEWLSGLSLDSRVSDVDQLYLNRLSQRWESLVRSDRHTVNATVAIETAHAGGFLMRTQAQLFRPSLLPDGWRQKLELTHSGNATESELIIENPSDSPVLAQLLPLWLYSSPQSAISLLATRLGQAAWEELFTESSSTSGDSGDGAIRLAGIGAQSEVARVHRDQLRALFGARVHPESLATLVLPRRRARFRFGFRPNRAGNHSAVFLLRNNLTALEALLVTGEAAEPRLRLAEPRLLFHASERANRPCGPIRRQLTLSNPGRLPLRIVGYSLGEDDDGEYVDDDQYSTSVDEAPVTDGASTCSDAGFSLPNCQPVSVEPNETIRLEVTFQPDYCLHRAARLLTLRPNAGPAISVLLQAAVPTPLLSACSARLPRPDWEHQLHTAVTLALIACGVCALASAYCESDRLLALDAFLQCRQQTVLTAAAAAASGGAPFDLRLLASTVSITNHSNASDHRGACGIHEQQLSQRNSARITDLEGDQADSDGSGGFFGFFSRLLLFRSAGSAKSAAAAAASDTTTEASAASTCRALLSSSASSTGASAAAATLSASTATATATSRRSGGVGQQQQHQQSTSQASSATQHHQHHHQQSSRRSNKRQVLSSSAQSNTTGAGGVIVGKESRSASTASAASSSAAQSSGVRPDPPQPIPTPQFEPIDFSNQRVGKGKSRGKKQQQQQQHHHQKEHSQQQNSQQQQQQKKQQHQTDQQRRGQSATPEDAEDARSLASESSSSEDKRSNTVSSEVHQPHTATLGNTVTLQHHHQQQQQASKTRRSGSISGKVSATTAAATSPAELIIKSIDKNSAAGQAEEIGGQGKAVNGGKGRRNGGNGFGAGGGRVKSRTTATNTPNSDVRQSHLQPILSVPAQPKAAPLQPAQLLKQPKTSIVKPMTHQKPKKEDLDEIARRTAQFSLTPQKGSPLWDTQPVQQAQPPPPPPPPPPPLPPPPPDSAWSLDAAVPAGPWGLPAQPAAPLLLPPLSQAAAARGELSQVAQEKQESLLNYEQLKRERLQQQQQQQQQTLLLQQEQQPVQLPWCSDGLSSSLDISWSESTVSNRNLWGGGVGFGGDFASSANNAPSIAAPAVPPASVGSADDPVARMLMGEQLLWHTAASTAPTAAGPPPPASSGWACFPNDGTGDC